MKAPKVILKYEEEESTSILTSIQTVFILKVIDFREIVKIEVKAVLSWENFLVQVLALKKRVNIW